MVWGTDDSVSVFPVYCQKIAKRFIGVIMKIDMTSGKPIHILLQYSLPLLAGSILQNLYNIFDTAIVGHILGKYTLAAVGNSYVPMLIINSIILGIASGISIFVARSFGGHDEEKIKECIGSVQTLILFVGIGLCILFLVFARWIFVFMKIPDDIIGSAAAYLRIISLGIPFLAIYNFYSALIKAKGNSKTPVQCISISCGMNILLDYLFVAWFRWNVEGAAIATVISQAAAAGMSVLYLYRYDREVLMESPNNKWVGFMLKLSITGIVQNGSSALSMFFIQGIINTFGVNEISAYSSAYKIEGILTMPAVNLGNALCVYVGQNMGAGNWKRTKQGLRDCFKIAVVITSMAMIIIWAAAPFLLYLVVGDEKEVIRVGVFYLQIISITFPLCVSLYLLTNFLRGAGEIIYPLFNTLLELSFRTISAFVLARYLGFIGVLLCRPLSFIVSTISLSQRYISGKWRQHCIKTGSD